MKETELRIGNLIEKIHVDYGRSIFKVEIEDLQLIQSGDEKISYHPIPLTEESLIKFGKIDWLSKDIIGYFVWFNGSKIYLEFVHLLQNLYFTLTGEELECI